VPFNFKKPARPVTKVFIHCSASDNPAHDNVATIDQWHRENGWAGVGYHFFIRKFGRLEMGRDLEKVPAAQAPYNAGTIAICLHGLSINAFTLEQFDTLQGLCHQINEAYDGAVTFHGHSEVAKKTCPVFIYRDVLNLTAEGALPRSSFAVQALKLNGPSRLPMDTGIEVAPIKTRALRLGDSGALVRDLQITLTNLGYFPGKVDGKFGGRTRSAVLAYQADNHLITDGIFGAASREALASAQNREVAAPRAAASLLSLAGDGSRIARASVGNTLMGAALSGGGVIAVVQQITDAVGEVQGHAAGYEAIFSQHGPWVGLAVIAAGVFVAFQSWRAGQARVDDHRTGKTA
jgi:peptidoglycan hydrolase-like protein with peptidoglycan-binding domain